MIIDERNNAASKPAEATEPQKPINIWLVDDNRRLRATMMEILGRCEGLSCTGSFHSPNAVLSALASKIGPDVILLDIQMGEACGLDAIRAIKALSRTTQVLMFTTCSDNQSKERALADGASDFLLKQFPLERIVTSIRRAAENPAPPSRRRRKPKCTAPVEVAPAATREQRLPWVKQCLQRLRARWN